MISNFRHYADPRRAELAGIIAGLIVVGGLVQENSTTAGLVCSL
jgi:hypothetical protein